jgi:cytoplasmic iron level regulating protein YaaA (DUF328/UPF0246 family)
MIILLHTSKTMRPPAENTELVQQPLLLDRATPLVNYLKTLSVEQIARVMKISPTLAASTHRLIAGWTKDPKHQRVAIDSFIGDIYSGLQVSSWDKDDREYANKHLRILSGLYGILRPLDGIYPYRLEMGYRLPNKPYADLYDYWGDAVYRTLPEGELIINLAALEYSKVVTDHLRDREMIVPSFLTLSATTGKPAFVTVHAKIARGAFARWLIKEKVADIKRLSKFDDIGYKYDAALSTKAAPVFVCERFGGKGLSVCLSSS